MKNQLKGGSNNGTIVLSESDLSEKVTYIRIDRLLNKRILKSKLFITNHYPELGKFVEEMNLTIPCNNQPGITTKILRSYQISEISYP